MKRKKMDGLLLIGGGVNLLLGMEIMLTPRWCSAHWPFCWDWSGYNVPLGVGVFLVGLFMLAKGVRKGRKGKTELICPKCEKPYALEEMACHQCPTCGVPLEPLDGFYERHPELKEKN